MLTEFYAVIGNPPEVEGALNMMAAELLHDGVSIENLSVALRRCRHECLYPVRLPHIFQRIPGFGADDGRPEPETAWAMCPKSEDVSVVWTEEMALAFKGPRDLLIEGDPIAARMAFKEAYISAVTAARNERKPPRWIVSLGYDKLDRVRALAEAVTMQRLTADHALELAGDQEEALRIALPETERRKLLVGVAAPNAARLNNIQRSIATLIHSKCIPEELKPEPAKPVVNYPKRSPESQLRGLLEFMKGQPERYSEADIKDVEAKLEVISK